MKILIKRIAGFLLLMFVIQAVRAAIHWVLWQWLNPLGNNILVQIADISAYSITGIVIYLALHPSSQSLGLEWKNSNKSEKTIYILAGVFLLTLTASSFFFSLDIMLENIKAVIIVPVFEELIFRGWGWQRIEPAVPGKHARAVTWVILSALFAIWHIGYTDIFYLRILPANPGSTLGSFLFNKVIFTFFFGLAVGFLRWKTRKVYGSVLFHGFLNLIGK